MKIIAIPGSSSKTSLNKRLLDYVNLISLDMFEMEIIEIDKIPIFNKDDSYLNYENLISISQKISSSDGLIIATPEHNKTIPAILKSLIEWLSYDIHPFKGKPTMIIGASEDNQGTSSAQLHLKQILDSPGVDAFVMPGNEFLLKNAHLKFDQDGRLIDEKTDDYLEHCLLRFMKYCELIKSSQLDNIESKFTMTIKAGGYINLDDPNNDGTAGESEY